MQGCVVLFPGAAEAMLDDCASWRRMISDHRKPGMLGELVCDSARQE